MRFILILFFILSCTQNTTQKKIQGTDSVICTAANNNVLTGTNLVINSNDTIKPPNQNTDSIFQAKSESNDFNSIKKDSVEIEYKNNIIYINVKNFNAIEIPFFAIENLVLPCYCIATNDNNKILYSEFFMYKNTLLLPVYFMNSKKMLFVVNLHNGKVISVNRESGNIPYTNLDSFIFDEKTGILAVSNVEYDSDSFISFIRIKENKNEYVKREECAIPISILQSRNEMDAFVTKVIKEIKKQY